MGWRKGLGVVSALALMVVPSAEAADRVATKESVAGPVFSGSDVSWAAAGPSNAVDLFRATPAGKVSRFARFPGPRDGLGLFPQLAASPQRLVLTTTAEQPFGLSGSRSVLTSPVGGAFETLDSGCGLFGSDRPRSVDVNGRVVVYARCAADGGRQQVIVRDYAMAQPVDQQIPGAGLFGLRIAGRFVAWLDDASEQVGFVRAGITVYDRTLGTVAYHLPVDSIPGPVHDLDLQADGKVAFSYQAGGGDTRIAWASANEPRLHRISLPRRYSYEVRIAGDRIAFEGGRSVFGGMWTRADVGVSDLAGHARKVGNLGEGDLFTDNFDFDGRRLTWWQYGCTTALIRVATVSGPAAISPPRQGCRLRFTRAPTVDSSGGVAFHVSCFGFPGETCDVHNVSLSRRGRIVARGANGARVKLTRYGRGLLRHGQIAVRATATLTDDSGRRERRSARLALRRR
jgi:hypothetical protein